MIARLRPQLARVTGISLFLNPVQDLRMGGRQSNSTYQYTLKSDNIADLHRWATRLAEAMKRQPALTDVDTDQQENGVETYVDVDKDTASRLGINSRDVDNALYDAFGQRQVATIYSELNQYHVVMGVAPQYMRSPEALKDIYVPARGAPASGARPRRRTAAGRSTASAATATHGAPRRRDQPGAARPVHRPGGEHRADARWCRCRPSRASPSGPPPARSITRTPNWPPRFRTTWPTAARWPTARPPCARPRPRSACRSTCAAASRARRKAAQESQQQQPMLIALAIVVIYIVLGVLYESLVHPVTVLSTLPSAGVGAVLALLIFRMELLDHRADRRCSC